jgi:hypothetical protein
MCHGCTYLLVCFGSNPLKNKASRGTLALANRLRFQRLTLATGVLALTGYFQQACRIGTAFATVFFSI